MNARLSNGEIVTLAKDCSCSDHEGPHWLHADMTKKVEASRALERRDLFEHIFMEQARLQAKAWHMQRQGIVELIPDGPDARP